MSEVPDFVQKDLFSLTPTINKCKLTHYLTSSTTMCQFLSSKTQCFTTEEQFSNILQTWKRSNLSAFHLCRNPGVNKRRNIEKKKKTCTDWEQPARFSSHWCQYKELKGLFFVFLFFFLNDFLSFDN